MNTIGAAGEEVAATGVSAFLENASGYALKVIGAILAFTVMMILAGIISRMVKRSILRHSTGANAEKIAKLMRDLVYYILLGFAVFVAFEVLGFDVGLLLGGVSFGIGLAFKEILGNMIAGMMILYTKEYKMGDVIEVQTGEGYFGRIEEITVRYTIIRTLDLRQVVIPNLQMISSPIKTFSSEELVKLGTTVGIHYDSDVEKAIQVTLQAINSLDFVKSKENTAVFVINFGASSIDLRCVFLFDPKCGMIGDFAVGLVNEAIGKAYNANNIMIPYQHTTITFKSDADKLKILAPQQ